MVLKFLQTGKTIALFSIMALVSAGCGSSEEEQANENEGIDTTKTTDLITVNGEIFSIPSPIQTAFLIKQTGANFNKQMLNDPKKSGSYSTNFQKALNLGVYGADLGYVTLYDQTQDAIGFMTSVKRLGEELGVAGAFDMSLMKRFEQNIGKKDSMLVLVSSAYRASDTYLKNNERNDVSGLVLAGGWIESLYFVTNVPNAQSNAEITRRIAEQKSSLQSLIKLLTPYYSQPEYTELIDSLNDLASAFEGVEFKYTYQKPTVDAEKKLTTINSTTEVKITPEQIKTISEKIQSIRTQIVG